MFDNARSTMCRAIEIPTPRWTTYDAVRYGKPLPKDVQASMQERAYSTSNTYYDCLMDHVYFLVPAQAYVGKFLASFKEFPPRQKAASFSIDQVLEKLQRSGGSK